MIREPASAVLSAIRTIENERQGLEALEEAIRSASEGGLRAAFSEAVELISAASGRVIVTGVGKSGHIGRKIAATLASTGQPASFVHSAEASHGDLGMVQNGDVVLGISWSGETAELAAIVTFAKRYAIPLIAMTANPDSALGREADVCLTMPNVAGSLPQRPRPDHLDDGRAGAGRRPGDGAARGARVHRARFPRPASGRHARRQARPCPRGHAHRRAHPAHRRQGADGRGDRRDDLEGLRLRGGVRRQATGSPASSPTATCAAASSRISRSTRRSPT